jgi:hypothetical protein
MPDINLDYLNDRYLAFVLPLELRRLVGQAFHSWFLTGNEEERAHFQEVADDAFPTIIYDLEAKLKSAIRRFTSLVECWNSSTPNDGELRQCSKALIAANQKFVKRLKATWYDERHRCHLKIANKCGGYEHLPSNLQTWDVLGKHHLDHDDGNRIIINNRLGIEIDDILIKKSSSALIISSIQTPGWYNSERQAISRATIALQSYLKTPHQQLFKLGCLFADVNWGDAWFDPLINPGSRRSLTTHLSREIGRLVPQLWFLISDKVSVKVRRLTSQATISSAIKVANLICELCHAGLYRSKNGWFEGEYERILLAYDLTQLRLYSEREIIALTTRVAKCLSNYEETLEPIDSIPKLNQLAKRYPMHGKVLQIGLEANRVGETSLGVLHIWNRISAVEQDNGQYRLSKDGFAYGTVDRPAGTLVKLLVAAEGGKVTAKQVADHLELKGRKRRMDEITKGIPRQIKECIQSSGRGGTHLVDPSSK